jgi:hypothetical protein
MQNCHPYISHGISSNCSDKKTVYFLFFSIQNKTVVTVTTQMAILFWCGGFQMMLFMFCWNADVEFVDL